MKRRRVAERPGWQQKFEELGFTFHSMGGCYWSEGVCYEFSSDQIDHIEEVSQELQGICLQAVEHVISNNLFSRMGIDEQAAGLARESWQRKDISLYGRFDFSYDGREEPKLLEYNADTPTSLYESSVAQWVWLEELYPKYDQFNSIHEKLEEAFAQVKQKMPLMSTLYFSCVQDNEEDYVTVEYMRDVAAQSGMETRHIYMEEIGYNPDLARFVDTEEEAIEHIFKLYPWEWLMADEFGRNIRPDTAVFYEPAWKMILSNKAILPILWELFPGHKNLLPAFFESSRISSDYVKKPILSREGANIEIVTAGGKISSEGTYGAEGYIYQAYRPLPQFDSRYAVVGSWIVNGLAAGIGIREDASPITRNTSNFVPHYFV